MYNNLITPQSSIAGVSDFLEEQKQRLSPIIKLENVQVS